MTKLFTMLFLAASFLSGAVFASEKNKDAIVGQWWTPSKDGRIEIYKEKDKYFGKIIWTKPELKGRLDKENPDPEMKTKTILGSVLLKNFKFDDGEYTEGTIYDPKNGKTYQSKLSLGDDGNLNVRGFIGFSWIGRTETFTPYKEKATM
ncbi:MAG: DUF2147 domain-containing protein [Pseudobacteriovorax sp.]|nr:DUF2147 domain-containing protein [Pseudobacteriovorax sp.]